MLNINEYKENEDIKKINFNDEINIEYYFGKNKREGYNIIRNNDMMQYHYFSQEYNVIKGASILCLLYVKHNNIKNYIGFISFNSPTLNKTLRNAWFGTNFLKKMFKQKTKENDLKFYTISRMVFIPSFRGIGSTKYIQDKIVDYLFQNPDNHKELDKIAYIEIYSAMLHNFDFSGNTFNKFFLKLKNTLTETQTTKYFESLVKPGSDCQIRGFKGHSKMIANIAFKFNKNYHLCLEKYFLDYYDVSIDESIYDEVNVSNEELQYFRENQLPLALLNIISVEELKKVKGKSA